MLHILRKLHRDKRGVTGLETAIILIAFVVVASVFAYTVLSAGIFSAQKGQEAINAGLNEAQASMQLQGSVTAYKGTVSGTATMTKVSFTVSTALNDQKVDLTPPYKVNATSGALESSGLDHVTLVTYQDAKQFINDAAWTVSFIGSNNGDYILDPNEKAVVTIWLANYDGSAYSLGSGSDPFISSSGDLPTTYTQFNLEAKPQAGASLSIQRTLPARLDNVMDLN